MTISFKLLMSSLELFMFTIILSTRFFHESVVTAVCFSLKYLLTRHLCKFENNKRYGKSHQ